MHGAFNLLAFTNYMFIRFFVFVFNLKKGCVLSGEIALKNRYYYYHFIGNCSLSEVYPFKFFSGHFISCVIKTDYFVLCY